MTGVAAVGARLAEGSVSARDSSRPVRVLLADDTDDLRVLMRLALEASGAFEVVAEAGNGREAVDLARQHRPDLVVIDVAMPVVGGLQAIPELRRSLPETRIAVLTVLDLRGLESQALAAGADRCLDKTRPPDELVAELADLAGVAVAAVETSPAGAWAAHALRESQAGFNGAFDEAAIGMALTDLDGRPLKVNPALCRILGADHTEVMALPLSARAHPEGGPPPEPAGLEVGDPAGPEGVSEPVELCWARADGSPVWVSFHAAAVRDAVGRPLYLFCQVQDISDRRSAEEGLRASETRFRGAWEGSANGMALLDPSGTLRMVNRHLCGLLGYTERDLVGRTLEGLTHPDDVQALEAVDACVDGRTDRFQVDARMIGADRRARWTMISGTAVRDEHGAAVFLATEIHDLTDRMAAQEALSTSEERYRTLVAALEEGVVLVDRNLIVQAANVSAGRMFDTQPERMVGHRLGERYTGEREDGSIVPEREEPAAQALRDGNVHRGLFVLRPPDGAAKWLAVTASPLRGADSTPDGVVLSLTDATRARNGELALKETMERFRLLAENSSDIIALHNADLSLRYVSPACRTILGYEPSELVDHNLLEMVAPEDMAVLVDLPDEETATFELRARTKDGRMVWLEVKLRRIVDWATGQVTEIQTASRDISERKRLEARLTELAMHDGLTGLANRVLLIDRLEHALARRGSGTHRVAVLFVDLDRFKLVNDTLGHAAGDAVLEAVGTRIRETVRPADTAARLGGDEFVVVCEDVSGEQEAVAVAERLEAALAAPHVLESGEVVVTASVGIVVTERHMPAEALLRMADVAMYEAKQDGRACHRLFR